MLAGRSVKATHQSRHDCADRGCRRLPQPPWMSSPVARGPLVRLLGHLAVSHHAGMRFSINIPNFGDFADARTVAVVAAAAEQAGWDALFVWDHVVHDKRQRRGQPFGDPWMLLTAAALTTSRLRLGTLVTPVAGEGLSSSPARWPPWTHSATEG
jgi:hypothetical protein